MKSTVLHVVSVAAVLSAPMGASAYAQTSPRSISPEQLQLDRGHRGLEVGVVGGGMGVTALAGVMSTFVALNTLDSPGDTARDFGIVAAVTGGASLVFLGVLIERITAMDRADHALTHLDSRVELRGRFNVSFFTREGDLLPLTLAACRGLGVSAADCPAVMQAWDDDLPTLIQAIAEFRQSHQLLLDRVQGDVLSVQSTAVFEQLTLREQRELGRDFARWMEALETELNPSTYRLLSMVGRIVLGTASTVSGSPVVPSAALRIGDSPVEVRPAGVAIRF